MGLTREKALQSLWKDTCTVIVREEATDPVTHLTDFADVTLFEDEPCRISFESIRSADGEHTDAAAQETKLFLSSNLTVPDGSKILVTRAERTLAFARSGESAVYKYHQEIPLERFREWT